MNKTIFGTIFVMLALLMLAVGVGADAGDKLILVDSVSEGMEVITVMDDQYIVKASANTRGSSFAKMAVVDSGVQRLHVSVADKASANSLIERYSGLLLYETDNIQYIEVVADATDVASEPMVFSVDVAPEQSSHFPVDETASGSRNDIEQSFHNVESLHARGLSGEGIALGIRDGDRVGAFAHPDISDTQIITSVGSANLESPHWHAAHVFGTMSGSGAMSELAGGRPNQWKGAAFNSTVASFDWQRTFAGDLQTMLDMGVIASNHSYGSPSSCYSLWGYSYGHLDTMLYDNPTHNTVIASGNYQYYCPNSNPEGWGVLNTQASFKNAISVGAYYPEEQRLSNWSSVGPLKDGRVFPSVMVDGVLVNSIWTNHDDPNSHGFYAMGNGTSMAAPLVTGIIGLLAEGYALENNGDMPNSAAVRAALYNGAVDVENSGIDYRSGYGLVNAEKSMDQLLEVQQFEISDGQVIQIPFTHDGSTGPRVKITAAWNDVAGVSQAAVALVQDIDIRVVNPNTGGTVILPYVLDPNNPSAHATRGRNYVDVAEQVEEMLPAGDYILEVEGRRLIQPEQVFVAGLPTVDEAVPTAVSLASTSSSQSTSLVMIVALAGVLFVGTGMIVRRS